MPEQIYPSLADKQALKPLSFYKKDFLLAALIGFLCALLIIPIFKNLAPQTPFSYALTLLVFLPVLSALGMLVADWLAKFIGILYQIYKFVLIGALNTFVDLGIMNLLIFLTGIAGGWHYSTFKGISFLVAMTNSYFWNKLWTFKKVEASPLAAPKIVGKEFIKFFAVSAVGFVLNVGAATLIVNVLGPQWGLNEKLLANIGALAGTMLGLAWNFFGYKLIVFKD